MKNATYTYEDVAQIEAEAHALRAQATFAFCKAGLDWVKRQFATPTAAHQNAA